DISVTDYLALTPWDMRGSPVAAKSRSLDGLTERSRWPTRRAMW
ncbi:uncharacterized protein METZ01_LOCUS351881, partial [marine metagenome]